MYVKPRLKINLPLTRFELVTSPLPRECSAPEPQGLIKFFVFAKGGLPLGKRDI